MVGLISKKRRIGLCCQAPVNCQVLKIPQTAAYVAEGYNMCSALPKLAEVSKAQSLSALM